jgi:hypothetical protein
MPMVLTNGWLGCNQLASRVLTHRMLYERL